MGGFGSGWMSCMLAGSVVRVGKLIILKKPPMVARLRTMRHMMWLRPGLNEPDACRRKSPLRPARLPSSLPPEQQEKSDRIYAEFPMLKEVHERFPGSVHDPVAVTHYVLAKKMFGDQSPFTSSADFRKYINKQWLMGWHADGRHFAGFWRHSCGVLRHGGRSYRSVCSVPTACS